MARIKFFERLYEVFNKKYNDISFENFAKSDEAGKENILSEYGIEYKGRYAGRYDLVSGLILIEDVKNPFTETAIKAKPVPAVDKHDSFALKHNQRIEGKLGVIDGLNADTPPEAVFVLDIRNAIINHERLQQAKRERCEQLKREEAEKIAQRKQEQTRREELLRRQRERIEQERLARLRIENERREAARIAREKERLACVQRRKKEIEPLVHKRKIRDLIHFTQLDNLDSILRHGVCSQKTIKDARNAIKAKVNDFERWDMRKDCVNVSIEFPNVWLLKQYKKKAPNAHWVVLVLSTELLYEQDNYYAYHNASTREISSKLQNLCKPEDFEAMFADRFTVHLRNDNNRPFDRNELTGIDYLPTSDQAEILVRGTISPKFIKRIIFSDEADMNAFRHSHEKCNIDVGYNSDIFNYYRYDFHWERR